VIEGFGSADPQPWFAVATMFHPETALARHSPLSSFLFRSFLMACRSYSASLRDALKATRMRARILCRLYADPLVQRFLQEPLAQTMDATPGDETPSGVIPFHTETPIEKGLHTDGTDFNDTLVSGFAPDSSARSSPPHVSAQTRAACRPLHRA